MDPPRTPATTSPSAPPASPRSSSSSSRSSSANTDSIHAQNVFDSPIASFAATFAASVRRIARECAPTASSSHEPVAPRTTPTGVARFPTLPCVALPSASTHLLLRRVKVVPPDRPRALQLADAREHLLEPRGERGRLLSQRDALGRRSAAAAATDARSRSPETSRIVPPPPARRRKRRRTRPPLYAATSAAEDASDAFRPPETSCEMSAASTVDAAGPHAESAGNGGSDASRSADASGRVDEGWGVRVGVCPREDVVALHLWGSMSRRDGKIGEAGWEDGGGDGDGWGCDLVWRRGRTVHASASRSGLLSPARASHVSSSSTCG